MRGRVAVALWLLGAVASAGADEARDAAKVHFDAGQSHYAASEWAAADAEFKEAFRLSRLPDLLLDMARAESKLGDEAQALRHLEQYLEEKPDADDAPSVRSEIEQRRRAIAQAEAAAKARAEADEAKRRADAAAAEARKARVRPRWPAYVLFAGAGALVIAGVISGALAIQQAKVVSGGGTGSAGGVPVDFAGQENGRYLEAQTSGKRDQTAGIALDAIGGAVAVAAIGVLIWALRPPAEAAPKRALIEAAPGGLQVRF